MLKERIVNLLRKHSLSDRLLFEFFSSTQETKDAIKELLEEGRIIQVRKEYYIPESLGLIKGKIVSIKENFSFAKISDEEDVYIDNRNLNSAFLNDEVYLLKDKHARKEEYIVYSIISRARKTIVGEIKNLYGQFILDVKDIATKKMTFVINPTPIKLFEGYIALCSIGKQTKNTTYVDVISLIGNKNDPGVDITHIILKHNANIEFPYEVKKELESLPSKVSEEEIKDREDFRDHLIVTIDGEDAKDFDDAVEVRRCAEGYEIGVHIADVAHYVRKGSALNKEALNRGTSIYVTDRVVPMLPFELSNGICSLNPNVDRLTTSCIFKMDPYGNILSSRITKGVIKSKARLTYAYVNEVLQKKNKLKFGEEVDKLIYLLNEVSTKLRKKRRNKGALDLDSTEIKFICNEEGEPIDVIRKVQQDGEKLIEDLMIAANEIVSETIESMGLAFIYRIHERPKSKKMETFMKMSEHMGYRCNFSSLKVTPKELQSLMDKVEESSQKKIMSMMLLRSLAKARYFSQNLGHFGLASTCYTHFTSPIRRYPDLLVHRLIDLYLVEGKVEDNKILKEEIDYIAENSSIKERNAITIEREVEDLVSAKYMATKIGNTYKGFINGMISSGFFVELENGIDGFVSFEDMSDDYYVYDESYMCAFGVRTHREYNLGDEVEVLVEKVSVEESKITFSLLNNKKTTKIVVHKKSKSKKGGKKNGRRN